MTSLRPSCWLAACLVASAGLGSVKAGEVARYSPKPGQVLTYEENQTFKGAERSPHTERPGRSGQLERMTTGAAGWSFASR